MDFQSKASIAKHTFPEFKEDAEILVKTLRALSKAEFSKVMKVSEKLADLNIERYASWRPDLKPNTGKQALLAFKGDIYSGMDVDHYNAKDFDFAQKHLRILSGLYGVLRPLDLMQPYRLEMATKLATSRGKNMYQFWGNKINESIKKLLKQEKSGVLVNLCSAEYFKGILPKDLDARIISPSFKEFKDGSYRFITLYAKKARGMMCNFIIQNHIEHVDDLKSFDVEDYKFNPDLSSENELVFTRGA
jgi:cytoplasmic iron level regulating protein YaaA (DUF328/UPF0246 family)